MLKAMSNIALCLGLMASYSTTGFFLHQNLQGGTLQGCFTIPENLMKFPSQVGVLENIAPQK